MNVRIITRDLVNPDAPPQQMVIDYDDRFQRKWLAKHTLWALRTKHSITSYPTTDAVTFEDRRVAR